MYELLLIFAVIGLMWLFREKQESVTIYKGDESSLNEASEYYWILRDNNIPFKYHIPYNWENFYQFGYKKSPVYIKVRKNDVIKARRIIWCHWKEKREMERNIKESRIK
ncbi:hypothetical protein [Oceanobacillus kapialis]|uniref:hypothetical protein n=1 Tax=Oceanobacillus kapialis TaxID=481353 RepID=UPI003850963D